MIIYQLHKKFIPIVSRSLPMIFPCQPDIIPAGLHAECIRHHGKFREIPVSAKVGKPAGKLEVIRQPFPRVMMEPDERGMSFLQGHFKRVAMVPHPFRKGIPIMIGFQYDR